MPAQPFRYNTDVKHWITTTVLAASLIMASLLAPCEGPADHASDTVAGMHTANNNGPLSMLLSRQDGGRLTLAGSEIGVPVPVGNCCAAPLTPCRSIPDMVLRFASAPPTLVSLGCLMTI